MSRPSHSLARSVLRVDSPGLGATLQDQGRPGWRRFGVPQGGAMDEHAAQWANRLLDNPAGAPVIELLLQGACLEVLEDSWIAVTGANSTPSVPMWRVVHVNAGDEIRFGSHRAGVWTYLAVHHGFLAQSIFGSCSVYARGGLCKPLAAGDLLTQTPGADSLLPASVAGRWTAPSELRDYTAPPVLRVHPGPQWDLFDSRERDRFTAQSWEVSAQSDRVGYRLTGKPLRAPADQIISEPVRTGAVQIPSNGQPIITMRDGPTVGGYPKLGVLDPLDLSWLAQCRPGHRIQFRYVD